MASGNFLIYGALGYMGKLFTQHALQAGLRPILAGRQTDLTAHAQSLGVEARVFGLDQPDEVAKNLSDVALVVNLAGPFDQTSRPLIEACLKTGTHYIDIAGEYAEMETAYTFHERAQAAGVMLMPGAGFGVVPTDLAAKRAAEALPGATKLTIGFATVGGASQGTLRTVLRDIHRPGVRREGGRYVPARPAEKSLTLSASGKPVTLVTNPWRADLFTAALSTGIPTIETYSAFPGPVQQFMRGRMLWLRDFLLKYVVDRLPVGPSPAQLDKGQTHVWAIAETPDGRRETVYFRGPEAYRFTALTLLAITQRILSGQTEPGFQTPSRYGDELIAGML